MPFWLNAWRIEMGKSVKAGFKSKAQEMELAKKKPKVFAEFAMAEKENKNLPKHMKKKKKK